MRKNALPRRDFLRMAVLLAAAVAAGAPNGEAACRDSVQPAAPKCRYAGDGFADGRPAARWRGFNLLEMFHKDYGEKPHEFLESDFRMMHEWGFNFARLPMDYRFWIVDGDWKRIDESAVERIDRAIALGRKWGVHVQVCMHRCPGYTVARPRERRDLFTDAEAQRVCAMHWALWNLRGPFGILDSERADVKYEDYQGHKLDRKLLELLQRY